MTNNEIKKIFDVVKLATPYKEIGNHNPVMTQRFGADPYVMVYEGRAYLYMTGDSIMKDKNGEVLENHYGNIYTINVISSSDLVNWTDHGSVYAASKKGAASWGNNSWAPAATYKIIDGKPKFFLYFANSGNGIAVLSSDDPAGPFTDPVGQAMISRKTPTCAEVEWLFDPAVLMDDDGSAYIYFGGGVPSKDKISNPGTARVAKLSDDMIHIDGNPIPIANVPYLFEDSGINKIGNTYYYSYCSNFDVTEEATKEYGFNKGEICTMTSSNPMGPFTYCKPILKNPEYFFGKGGNNHHCMFAFNGNYYMSYHTRLVEEAMGVNHGYRSTNIDLVNVNEHGEIVTITGTKKGVDQVGSFDPYQRVPAATMAIMAGLDTTQYGESSITYGSGDMIVTDVKTGSFIGLYGVDFKNNGAKQFTISARGTSNAFMKICIDSLDGEVVGYVELNPADASSFQDIVCQLDKVVTGKHDLYFVFKGENIELKDWIFE